MRRCQFFVFCLLSLAVGLGDLAGAEKVKFGNSTKTNVFENLPPMAALDKGFFKEQGLDVEWSLFDAGAAHVRAVAGGAIDAGITAATEVVHAASRGIPMAFVADLQIDYDFFIWVRPDSPIKEPKDLKGTTLGVTRLGSLSHIYGRVAAKGLGMEKDIRFAATGGVTPSVAAVKAGSVQGIILSNLTMAVPQFRGDAKTLLNVRDYLPKPWMGLGVFGRNDFMEKSPEVTRRLVKAVLKGTDFVRQNREWSVEKMKEMSGYPEEVGREVHKILRYGRDGRIDVKGLESVIKFMAEWGLIEKTPPLEKIYNTKFVE